MPKELRELGVMGAILLLMVTVVGGIMYASRDTAAQRATPTQAAPQGLSAPEMARRQAQVSAGPMPGGSRAEVS